MPETPTAAVAIIAGGETAGSKLEGAGANLKALLDIGGVPMVAHVVRAARATPSVGRVLVIGPESLREAVSAEGAELSVPRADTFIANIRMAAQALSDYAMILVTCCDIPLVSPEGLEDFIQKGFASGAEFCYPIVTEEAESAAFPGGDRTIVRLRDGRFTGGNAVLVTPDFLRRQGGLIERTFEARKSKLQLVRILGFPFVIRFFLGLLTIERIERRAGEILGGSAKAIVSEDPALGFDVDKLSDLDVVRAHLARQAGA